MEEAGGVSQTVLGVEEGERGERKAIKGLVVHLEVHVSSPVLVVDVYQKE